MGNEWPLKITRETTVAIVTAPVEDLRCASEPLLRLQLILILSALFLRRTLGRTFLGFSCRSTCQEVGGFRVFSDELAKLGDVDFSIG